MDAHQRRVAEREAEVVGLRARLAETAAELARLRDQGATVERLRAELDGAREEVAVGARLIAQRDDEARNDEATIRRLDAAGRSLQDRAIKREAEIKDLIDECHGHEVQCARLRAALGKAPLRRLQARLRTRAAQLDAAHRRIRALEARLAEITREPLPPAQFVLRGQLRVSP